MNLSDDEHVVLLRRRHYWSMCAGVKDFLFYKALIIYSTTFEDWKLARQSCVDKGLMNRNGTLTTLGRNSLVIANLSLTVKG